MDGREFHQGQTGLFTDFFCRKMFFLNKLLFKTRVPNRFRLQEQSISNLLCSEWLAYTCAVASVHV